VIVRLIGLIGVAGILVMPSLAAEWELAKPGYLWQFPKDHWAHPTYRNEWWYFTGHVETNETPPRRFGYQFTLFRIGLTQSPAGTGSAWKSGQIIMGHAALSDIQTGKHYFHDTLVRDSPLLGTCLPSPLASHPSTPICWMGAPTGIEDPWSVTWDGKGFQFRATTADFAFDFTTRPEKPLIFQGPGGLSRKTADGSSASLYYSFTRLRTTGTLSLKGEMGRLGDGEHVLSRLAVSGTSWMDKEFGSGALGEKQTGWDWFSLQLNDGREVMLYILRKADGTPDHTSGTLIEKDGTTRYLSQTDFTMDTQGKWKSPHTGATYPAGWRIQIPLITVYPLLEITVLVPDSENVSTRVPGLTYWEGAVQVSDAANEIIGQGYVELTGYTGSVKELQLR